MKKNVGTVDKIIRGILGLVFIYFGVFFYTTSVVLSIVLFVIGLLLIITSMTGFCFLYTLIGVNTKKDTVIPPTVPQP
ncbi:MAG: DUF2892 domain-containing protein [Patescibacteria group bacterium]